MVQVWQVEGGGEGGEEKGETRGTEKVSVYSEETTIWIKPKGGGGRRQLTVFAHGVGERRL